MRVFVIWATVLEEDRKPPLPGTLALLTDPRVDQFWDPKRGMQAEVGAAAARGMKLLEEFKPGEHTPYDLVLVYRSGTRWGARIPAPVLCGSPVAGAMEEVQKALGPSAPAAGAPVR